MEEVTNEQLSDGKTSLREDADEVLDGLSIEDRRRARIDEYEESAVSRADPGAALLGMGTANLQRVAEQLGLAILDELENQPPTIDAFRELGPEIRMLAKIHSVVATDVAFQKMDVGHSNSSPHRKKGITLDASTSAGKRQILPKRWPGGS